MTTDEELGAAIRELARKVGGQDDATIEWYAARLAKWSKRDDLRPMGATARIMVTTNRPEVADGIIEHLLELVTGSATACVVGPVHLAGLSEYRSAGDE